jgi:hypothetical protein
MFALSEFDIRYQPVKAVKGQALTDLIAERISTNIAALSVRMGHVLRRFGLLRGMWYRHPARIASRDDVFFFDQIAYPLHQQSSRI